MAPATPPRPSLSGEEEGSKARDRPKRDQPEAPGSDDGAGCKRPRLVLPDPAADEGATPRRHLAFLDPAADEGATPRRHLAFLDPAADEGATPRHHLAFLDPAADEGTTPRRHLPFLDPAADKGATPRHHLPFLDPAADKGALLPGVQTFPSGPGGEERGSRGRARSREEVGTNGDKEVSRGHAQGREEGALSPNLSFLHLNAGEGADAVVHDNSSGRGGSGYGKGDKFENGAEAQEEILEKFENGQEGLQPQAHEEISKSEEILEKFENSKEGSRLLVQEVSMNEAVLDLEKEQMKEDLPDPLQSLEYALLDEFATMHVAYYSIELLRNELAGAANLTPALRDAAENAWRFIKDRLPVCRALIRRIREANGPSYSVPEIYLQ